MIDEKKLIEKLEKAKIPEIVIQSHRHKLKMALLDSECFKKRKGFFWPKLLPAGAILALIFVFTAATIRTKSLEAMAMEIAKNDPAIKKSLEENKVAIKSVKIKKGKAYLLLSMPENKMPEMLARGNDKSFSLQGVQSSLPPSLSEIILKETGEPDSLTSSVVEIDFADKKVLNIKNFETPIAPLSDEEKNEAINVVKNNPKLSEMNINFGQSEISIKPMPPERLHMEKENDEIKLIAKIGAGKKAMIKIKEEGLERVITVNLSQNKIEDIFTKEETEIENEGDDDEMQKQEESKGAGKSGKETNSEKKNSLNENAREFLIEMRRMMNSGGVIQNNPIQKIEGAFTEKKNEAAKKELGEKKEKKDDENNLSSQESPALRPNTNNGDRDSNKDEANIPHAINNSTEPATSGSGSNNQQIIQEEADDESSGEEAKKTAVKIQNKTRMKAIMRVKIFKQITIITKDALQETK